MQHHVHVKFHSEALLEELEARQLFSGGIEGILAENNGPEIAVHMEVCTEPELIDSPNSITISVAEIISQELVFIDTDVDNYQQLLNDIISQSDEDRNIEVILLDNQRDGIEQITEALAGFNNLDAVHLISHGSDGSVDIGSTILDAETLNQNLLAISDWGDAFTEEGDFLIYGCNLAATEDGQSLVQSLSSLTHTDVAASDDLTGHAELGGDWELEFNSGTIESTVVVSAEVQQSWNSILAETVHVSHALATNNLEIKDTDPAGQTFKYTSGDGSYNVNRISVQLLKNSPPNGSTVTVALHEWNGTNINGAGTLLGSNTMLSSNLANSFTWYDFDFSNVTLTDGVSYIIKITASHDSVFIAPDDNARYNNGTLFDKGGNTDSDMAFKVSSVSSVNQFVVTTTADSGTGSLRQAILDANANANSGTPDIITFDIATDGSLQTITLSNALPSINEAVIIDGFSQYGALNPITPTPRIEINGAGTTDANGLLLISGSDGSTVKGLVINNFDRDGILIDESHNHIIAGNYIGTDASGVADEGNGKWGIEIYESSGNTIGGILEIDRNVISGNEDSGIMLYGAGTTGNNIQGNYIGTNAAGTAGIANTGDGIAVYGAASNNTIGGSTAEERNVISGNSDDGIEILNGAFSNTVSGNYIGTDYTGDSALGNGRHGVVIYNGANANTIGGTTVGERNVISANNAIGILIYGNNGSTTDNNLIQGNYIGADTNGTGNLGNGSDGIQITSSADSNTIGGTVAGAGNIIAYSGSDGVDITDTAGLGNAILGNSIFSSFSQGIDIGISGIQINDSGANNLQNFPIISSATTDGAGLIDISGTFNSTASTTFRLEFFSNTVDDGNGEGETYLGFVNVTTNESGDVTYGIQLSETVTVGSYISATATNLTTNDTSEFAVNIGATLINTAPTFTSIGNGDGIDIENMGTGWSGATDSVILSDGKIMVLGSDKDVNGFSKIVLTRYNADGTLDTSFGTNGHTNTSISSGNDQFSSMALQDDGKLVITGYSDFWGGQSVVARFNMDGSLDISFDNNGYVTVNFGNSSESFSDVQIQTNGKIVATGYAIIDGHEQITVARFDTDGLLDATFDTDGLVIIDIGGVDDRANALTIQSDGRLFLVGQTYSGTDDDIAVVRLNSNGSLDNSFDGDGIRTISINGGYENGYDVAMDANGQIVIAAVTSTGSGDSLVIRLNSSDGSYDTSFNGTGYVSVVMGSPNEGVNELAIQNDGKIIVVGDAYYGDNDASIFRLNSDGALDVTFSGDGKIINDISSGGIDSIQAVNVKDNGEIIIVGNADGNQFIASYNSDGSVNANFSAVTTLDGTPTFTEGGGAVVLDANVQIFDVELSAVNDFEGSTLTLVRNGGVNGEDVFLQTGTITALNQGFSLEVDGVVIGAVITNSGGTLEILFTNAGPATNALVNSFMQQIGYSNSSDNPPASVQIDWTFNDGNTGVQGTGGAFEVTNSTIVTINAVNDASVVDLNGSDGTGTNFSTAFTENGGAVKVLDTDAVISDVDSTSFEGLGINLSAMPDGASEQVIIAGNVFTYNVGKVIVLNVGSTDFNIDFDGGGFSIGNDTGGTMPLADLQSLINSITYLNTSDNPTAGDRTIDFKLQDASLQMGSTSTATITVNPQNDAPIIYDASNVLISDSVFINEIHYDNTGTDEGEAIELAGVAGQDLAGWKLVLYNGNDGTVYRETSLTGSFTDQHFGYGFITVNYAVNGVQNDMEAIALVDAGGNVVQFISYEGSLTAVDGAAIGLTSTNIDPDVNDATNIKETASTPVGFSLQLNGAGSNQTWSVAAGNTFDGINTTQDFSVGLGTLKPESVLEDTALTFSTANGNTIIISDADADSGASEPMLVTLSVSHGTLTLGGTAGLLSWSGDGTDSISLSGSIAEVNAALEGLVYQGVLNYSGSDILTVFVDDQGNTGGGSLTFTATKDITVTPDNDEQSLDINAGLTLNEGATKTVTNTLLSSSDVEQTATQVVYTLNAVPANGALKLSGTSLIDNGTFTQDDIDNNRIIYIHDGGKTIADSFDFSVDDGLGAVTSATFSIAVTPINESPSIAINTGAAVAEGGTVTLSATHLNEGDVDDSGVGLTYSVTTVPVNGQLELTTAPDVAINSFTQDDIDNNRLIYVHNGSQTSADSFDFLLADGLEDGAVATTGTFNLSISNVNDAPVNTVPGTQSVDEDTLLAIGGISVDDVDGNLSTVQLSVSDGNLSISVSGTALISAGNDNSNTLTLSGTQADINIALASLTYQGNLNFNGSDTLTVLSTDSDAATDSKTVAINVNPVDDTPTISAIANQTIDEDNATGALTFSVADAETATGSLTVTASSDNQALISDSNLTLVDLGSGNWTVVATPLAQQNGTATITVTVNDGTASTADTFDVIVSAVNDNPTNEGGLLADLSVTEDQLTALDFSAINLSDIDAGTGSLTLTLTSSTGGNISAVAGTGITIGGSSMAITLTGTLTDLNSYLDSVGKISYLHSTADINGNDADTLAVTINDNGNTGSGGGTDIALGTVNIDIATVNDAPTVASIIADQNATEDTAFSFTFDASTFNDIDGDSLTYTSDASDWLSFDPDTRTFSGIPLNTHVGIVTVLVTANDGRGGTVTQSFDIVISNANDDAVIAGVDTGIVQEDVSVLNNNISTSGLLSISDDDIGEAVFIAETIAGSYGELVMQMDGNWIYTANNAQTAIQQLGLGESITETLTVSSADNTTHNVVITINGTDDISVIGGTITGSVTEDGVLTSTASLSITDADSSDSTQFANIVAQAGDNGYGAFSITANTWTFTLDNNHTAVQALDSGEILTETYTFTAPDGVTQQVTVTIYGAEDKPVFNSTPVETATEGDTYRQIITVTDVEVEAVSITASSLPAWLRCIDNGDGTAILIGTPGNAEVGDHSVVLRASDGTLSASQSFTVTVAGSRDDSLTVSHFIEEPGISTTTPINESREGTELVSAIKSLSAVDDGQEEGKAEVRQSKKINAISQLFKEVNGENNSNGNEEELENTVRFVDDSNYFKAEKDDKKWNKSLLLILNEIDLQLGADHDLFELSEIKASEDLWSNIDLMREQMNADTERLEKQDLEIEFVAGATIGITAGVVNWVLRGGALLSSLLSSASLFKQFDPLAVAFTQNKSFEKVSKTDNTDDQNDVERLFDKNNE
jgi:uncharacterized delta-60 repeat protein